MMVLMTNYLQSFSIEVYYYSNFDRSRQFKCVPAKGCSIEGIEQHYFNSIEPKEDRDNTVYRLFMIKPWMFWKWGEYLTSPYYNCPYLK